MQEIVDRLKALSDMTRLKIFKLILEQEFSVCELARLLNVSQPAVSQHLRRLKAVGLAEEERRGQWIYYKGSEDVLNEFTQSIAGFFASPLDKIEDFNDILILLSNRKNLEAECQNNLDL
ncbi:MAG: metalloregulator ArsR/SmtB family transcription factor [Firmicutes bacterium]|nr:metalloregulator ArsR/SmtB family transcription factor [Bacillota bacterium]MDD4262967.1 metalloregulator ArsR/SmtB family transcription factor [Bacillota bacterium]MDD4693851.1 metalloregulator ArsR/SmtB family transcription factor [Bacillota bacterium]